MSERPRLRVLLADDHAEILRAVQCVLEPSCEVVGLVTDGLAVLEAVMRLKPDVVVLDISMRAVSGLDVCRQIKRAAPQTKIVILTAFVDADISRMAVSLGASALVPKYSVDDLLSAVHGL